MRRRLRLRHHRRVRRRVAFGLAALAFLGAAAAARAAAPLPALPLSYPLLRALQSRPDALRRWQSRLLPVAPRGAPTMPAAPGSPWQGLAHPLGFNLSNPLLLTDGTVIAHIALTQEWYRLTPDGNGDYVAGTWSKIADLPEGYGPEFFASAVLPDGRVVINGGEFNFSTTQVETNLGAIWDPHHNLWDFLRPPGGWTDIGDAQSVVLAAPHQSPAGGKAFSYMLADATSNAEALLDTSALSWTVTGFGKFDSNNEEGWTLLPDGSVLTVDAYVAAGFCASAAQRYLPATGRWIGAGHTPEPLADCANAGNDPSNELGPQVLLPPRGVIPARVVAFAGVTGGGVKPGPAAPTAIFDTATRRWAAGPDVPAVNGQNDTLDDAPAAVLPSGNILFAASPSFGRFVPPTDFFEMNFDATAIRRVEAPPDANKFTAFQWNFLVLPTGQVLACETTGPNVWIYTEPDALPPDRNWRPTITDWPRTVAFARTYSISGRQLNGLTQGAAYGDDVQANTNYPLVQIRNIATGRVVYATTFDHGTMSVAAGILSSTRGRAGSM